MNTTKHLFAVALVGTAAWNFTALSTATTEGSTATEQKNGEKSQAWLEAKSVFTPVNELRESSDAAEKAASPDGTTMRLLGLGSGQNLTVFPPVDNKPVVAKAPTQPQPAAASVKIADASSSLTPLAEKKTIWRQPEAQQTSGSDSELVLLPSVESVGSSSAFLTSSQSNDRIAYASRAFASEEAAEQALQGDSAGQYIQENGSVEWGSPVVPSGCCDSGCDSCCTPCCQTCCRPPILVVSTEAVFLSPTVNGTSVFYQFDDFTTPETLRFGPATGYGALDDFYAAPRISVGWQGCCWGVMGRYYHMRAAEHAHNPLVNHGSYGQLANQTVNVCNILEAYYTDLEITRNFCCHGCKSQFGFGCRYALISHDESIDGRSIDPNSGSFLQGGARRNRSAHGTGLTMGLNLRKPLFCNSCAHWFFSGRTSILWGNTSNDVESRASVVVAGPATVAAAGSIDGASTWVADDLFIGEVQAGIEWDFALRCLPAKAFFRTAFEYQYWDGSIGSAASGSFAGFDNGANSYQVSTGSWAPGIIADFVGLSIGTGFTW